MTGDRAGLRERKKRATREALRTAALRLALERGVENVRVDDIAEAAGVSPRTYNNYFSSREQAIVAAVTADRDARVAAAVAARPAELGLAEAVVEAVVTEYTDPPGHSGDVLPLITTSQHLRARYAEAAATVEGPLADALADAVGARGGRVDRLDARVLAAAVGAAVRVAVREWLDAPTAAPADGALVVPSGALPDRIRAALAPLAPALDAADARPNSRRGSNPSER